MPRPSFDDLRAAHKPTGICVSCGETSTLLCDGRIYTLPDGRDMRVPMNFVNGKTRSCDVRICRLCAKKVSDIHIRSSQGCSWNSVDLCPACVAANEKPFAKGVA